MEDRVLFNIDENQIAHLTLNHPEAHNAFDNEMLQTMTDYLRPLHENTSVRALVLAGNGESFCAGADLSWMERASKFTEDENFEDARLLSFMLHFLDTLLIPIITYVQGNAMGGGLGLIACSDIVLADSSTLFSFSEVKVGLVPAIVSPYVLRNINSHFARRYFLTGEKFDASRALQMGLVHEIIDRDTKDSVLENFLQYILSASPSAVMESKKLIQYFVPPVTEIQRVKMIELNVKMSRSPEGVEGIKSFLSKQSPSWAPKKIT